MDSGHKCALWVKSIQPTLDGEIKDDRLSLSIKMNDTACLLMTSSFKTGTAPFDQAILHNDAFKEMSEALRAEIHSCGWPFMMKVSVNASQNGWCRVRVENIGMANAYPRSHYDDPGDWESYKNPRIKAVDDIVRSSHVIGSLVRPTNRPVRSWSTIGNMGGSSYVHHDEVHARTEAEFVLKKLWSFEGLEALEKTISSGRFEKPDWLQRTRFISSELEDLDLNPSGRILNGGNAIDELNEALSFSQPSTPGL